MANLAGIPALLQNLRDKVAAIGRTQPLSPLPKFLSPLSSDVSPRQPRPTGESPLQNFRMTVRKRPPPSTFFQGGQLEGRASSPPTPQQFEQDILGATEETDFVTPLILSALLSTESSFNPQALGPPIPHLGNIQAQGIAQFLPSTARGIARQGLVDPFDPLNPSEAIPAAALFLDDLIRQEEGNVLRGIGRFKGGINPEALGFAQEVLDLIGL